MLGWLRVRHCVGVIAFVIPSEVEESLAVARAVM